MLGRLSEAETKEVSTKKFGLYVLYLMNQKRIFRRNSIYLAFNFRRLNLVGERNNT